MVYTVEYTIRVYRAQCAHSQISEMGGSTSRTSRVSPRGQSSYYVHTKADERTDTMFGINSLRFDTITAS